MNGEACKKQRNTKNLMVPDRPATTLGHQVGRRVFLKGAQIFQTMYNTFSSGGEKNLGGFATLRLPW